MYVYHYCCFSGCESKCLDCSVYECHSCQEPYLLQEGKCVAVCHQNYHSQAGVCHYNVDKPSIQILEPLVVEFGKPIVVNSSLFYIQDGDTQNDKLTVIVHKLPSNGALFRFTKGRNVRLKRKSKFTVRELEENQILYQHEKNQPLYGEMQLAVSDEQYRSRPEVISINVISVHPPQIVVNEPLIVLKGQSKPITTNTFNIHDYDNPESVTIKIIDGPNQGELSIHDDELGLYTLDELSKGLVMYTHNSSGLMLDLMSLQVSDGHNTVNSLFYVHIMEEEHSTPVLVRNQGAHVRAGQRVQISQQLLQASDIDSDDENLVYTLLPMLQDPGQGEY